jgi:hypothetical protein
MAKDRESPETTIFDSFVPATWAEYQKMLDAHERAAWLEGFRAARLMYNSQVIPDDMDKAELEEQLGWAIDSQNRLLREIKALERK